MDAPKEVLLGRLAVQRGLITQAQLDLAMRAQAERGGKTPLSGIFLERGLLSPKQLGELVDLQKQAPAPAPTPPAGRGTGQDALGKRALESGLITQEQLQEALRVQAHSRGSRHPKRLGEVLVEKGYMTFDQVYLLLGAQGKRLLRCPLCGDAVNVHDSAGSVNCPRCDAPLVDAASAPEKERPLKAKGTWYGKAVDAPPPAATPKAGRKSTKPHFLDYQRRFQGASSAARWVALPVVAGLVVVTFLAWRAASTPPPLPEASHATSGPTAAAGDASQVEFDALKAFLSAHEADPLACLKRVRDLQPRYEGKSEAEDLVRMVTLYEGKVNAPCEPIYRDEMARAAALEKEDRFGDAISALADPPPDKDPLLYWSMKLAHERGQVPNRARERWLAIASEAEGLATAGKWDEAFASAERGERLGVDEVASLAKERVAALRVRQQAAIAAAEHAGDVAAEAEDERRIGLVVAEWQTCVRRFRFAEAAGGYERCLAQFRSAKWKKELEARLEVARSLAALERRFFDRVNEGKVRDLSFQVGDVTVTITKAVDEEFFECKFPGGAGRGVWSTLGTEALFGHLEESSPTPAERLALGALAWDLGYNDLATGFLIRALKADATLAHAIDLVVSQRRGIPVPAEGFVAWHGRFVTPEEKTNLEKGLVLFEGQWVTPADREMLARGMQKIGDKWLPRDEAELVKLGYTKYKGKWYSKEEYAALRSKWDSAYTAETAHYDIRTNASQDFANELAKVAEADYAELKIFYGGKEPRLPGKEKMTLNAYAAYEDYKKYCVENHAEAELQAAGFAMSNGTTVVGWDKAHDRQSFLETMAHEAAHLYYFKSVAQGGALASWYAEGMATQFEGFHKKGDGYEYDRRANGRIWFLKQAVASGKQLTLDQLVSGDAISLINSDPEKALVFYAECWGLVYFLTHTDNKTFASGFQSYRESADRGSSGPLGGFLDLRALEPEFLEFVKKL